MQLVNFRRQAVKRAPELFSNGVPQALEEDLRLERGGWDDATAAEYHAKALLRAAMVGAQAGDSTDTLLR